MIKASILGANGYTGFELVRLLSQHPEVEIKAIISRSNVGKKMSDLYPSLKGVMDMDFIDLGIDQIAGMSDVVFAALPHGVSATVLPMYVKKGVKVIDLSGDFRYDDPEVYKKWYGQEHTAVDILKKAVYGLTELNRERVTNAQIIGNPGCFTTCSILALTPILAKGVGDTKNIIIDAKSGVSGAGRTPAQAYHFTECTETMLAYKVASHRHTSEIEQELSKSAGTEIRLSFTPHLVPMKRGIFATCYVKLTKEIEQDELVALYKDFYKDDYFVRVYDSGSLPEIHNVTGSNYADIGIVVDKRLSRAVIIGCIDNLVKGASGQAIQNMNVMFGLEENTGLKATGLFL